MPHWPYLRETFCLNRTEIQNTTLFLQIISERFASMFVQRWIMESQTASLFNQRYTLCYTFIKEPIQREDGCFERIPKYNKFELHSPKVLSYHEWGQFDCVVTLYTAAYVLVRLLAYRENKENLSFEIKTPLPVEWNKALQTEVKSKGPLNKKQQNKIK